ncbi:MAG: hypothetical protein ACHQ4H_14660 [Ktedonobacterales bacterium]
MKSFWSFLFPMAMGMFATLGLIMALDAATHNLYMSFGLAGIASVVLAVTAARGEDEALKRQRERDQRRDLSGGRNDPLQIPSHLEDLPLLLLAAPVDSEARS